MTNFEPGVKMMLRKLLSCIAPTSTGQITLSCMVKPPIGDAAAQYHNEKRAVLESLRERAILVESKLNQIPGISCNPIQGALYAFPRIEIPEKAIKKARVQGVEPDFLYCMELLEETGICAVPGSGFKQVPGTFHFRMTILPPKEQLQVLLKNLQKFNLSFRARYSLCISNL
jgi:alanine transaminase